MRKDTIPPRTGNSILDKANERDRWRNFGKTVSEIFVFDERTKQLVPRDRKPIHTQKPRTPEK